MRAKLSESRPDARSFRSSDSGDSFLCCSRATCSNSDVMVARTDISAGSNAPGAIHYTGSGSRASLSPPWLLYSPQSLCPPQRPVCPIRGGLEMDRREFLMATTAAMLGVPGRAPSAQPSTAAGSPQDLANIAAAMTDGRLTARGLTQTYLDRIEALDRHGPTLRAVLETNPRALDIAAALDEERLTRGPRGPLHGVPILIKDNVETSDRMMTTAGSLALDGWYAPQDAPLIARLRAAGVVILGKTNLSEWANFRSTHSSSGWSGRGGQCNMPYVLDRNPCGSSSGSGAAAAANLAAIAVATETDGSIVCPAGHNGVAGIKPTVGLTSRAGVVPISHTQDTVGPHGWTLADAAIVLDALAGVDTRDEATAASAGRSRTDYAKVLDPAGLQGARLGVCRSRFMGY